MKFTNKLLDKFVILLVALISMLYIWAVLRYTSYLPYWDDYEAVLRFLNNFYDSDISEKVKLFFSQHNEHRIVFNCIVELLQLKLFGEINFLYLVLIGNVGWFLVIYLLWRYAKSENISFIYFSPVLIVLLAFSHYELMTWAMASIQQYYQILFSLISIYFLVNEKLFYALGVMILSIFTGGGGIVLIPLFVVYMILHRNWKNLFVTLMISAIILFVYFVVLGYEKPGHHPSILNTLKNPKMIIEYILVFIGSLGGSKTAAATIGTALIIFFAYKLKYSYKKTPFLVWSILFILGTATVTALARAGFGIEQALSSRYSEYSLLFLSLIYLQYLFTEKQDNSNVILIGYLFSIIIFSFWFVKGSESLKDHYTQIKNTPILYPDQAAGEQILLQSYGNGLFTNWRGVFLPSQMLQLKQLEGKNDYCIGIAEQIDICSGNVTRYHDIQKSEPIVIISAGQKDIKVEGWTVDSIHKNKSCGAYIVLNDNKKVLVLHNREDVSNYFNNKKYLTSGFSDSIDISNLPAGNYTMSLRTVDSTCSGYYESIKVNIVKESYAAQ